MLRLAAPYKSHAEFEVGPKDPLYSWYTLTPLAGGLLHLVQEEGAAGPEDTPSTSTHHCTKRPPVKAQCTNFTTFDTAV